MKYRYISLTLVSLFLSVTGLVAQETGASNAEEPFKPHSTLGLVIAHAHVFSGVDENGKKKVLALPSWGIDYNYHFSEKWALGLHTDIILESFKVESHEGTETFERKYPIAPAIVGMFKPNKHWGFIGGAGAEFAKEENFFLTRLGIEYGAELGKQWEVFGSLAYDIKWNAYDTWVLGLGITRKFGGGNKHQQ